jgi:hypothetical protein
MERTCHKLLARAGLTQNEHRRVAIRSEANRLLNAAHPSLAPIKAPAACSGAISPSVMAPRRGNMRTKSELNSSRPMGLVR